MIDFKKIKTCSLKERKNKFNLESMLSLKDSKPLVENENLQNLSIEMKKSRQNNKQLIFLMGAHLIKLGLSSFINDLIKKGYVTHVAMSGAGAIHDFELAYIGATSEDVAKNIENGSFGMAEETGFFINEAAKIAARKNTGFGYEIGKLISGLNCKYQECSILHTSHKFDIPATVHTAIGTEIIYQHPDCDGGALGKSSYDDFKKLAESISKLEEGVVLNIGSAVILPEVFLKAFTIARNLGHRMENFTAANMDMIDHYRPKVNVVQRPTSLGGKGYTIIEKHEKSIPTLHYLLMHN